VEIIILPFVELPEIEQDKIICSISAAIKYEIPANIMLAVVEKEAGTPGKANKNSNGTWDIGLLQFNSSYISELNHKYGISFKDVAGNDCYSYDLAAWRIRGHIKNDKGNIWIKASNYHSRTPKFNLIYRTDLINKSIKWADWLESQSFTFSISD
jgi:hypothetical protein